MTPETQQARTDVPRGAPGGDFGRAADPARTGPRGAVAQPSHAAPQPPATAKRVAEDAGIVRVIPLLAVLVVTVAGVYIAWYKGSAGAGEGGVVGGVALLVAAVARLLLPSRLAGLLATRRRPIDVFTLAIFGVGLLVTGLVLPH
jgi:Protein of unknown function (DUF3017)